MLVPDNNAKLFPVSAKECSMKFQLSINLIFAAVLLSIELAKGIIDQIKKIKYVFSHAIHEIRPAKS